MNRPRMVLYQALVDDLRPILGKLREMGWPVEARVETDPALDGRFAIIVEIRLDHVPVPLEGDKLFLARVAESTKGEEEDG